MSVTSTLIEQAQQILHLNDRGSSTIPSTHLYPHQWAWDSAFAAIGWAYIDLDRAVLELETLMQGMWTDGRIPHIQFNENVTETYFPDANFWKAGSSSSITQPPAWAIATRRLYELGASRHRLTQLLPKIESSHLFFEQQRDPLSWGLVSVAHPWESGLDNSPAWDLPMNAIDPNRAPPFKRVDQAKVADPSMRPTDEEYKRYATLVKDITASNFGHGPFKVYCPLMTSILAKAEEDLAFLADELNFESNAKARAQRLYNGLEQYLYHSELKRFCYYDITQNERYTPDVIGAYAPLMLQHAFLGKEEVLQALIKTYSTEYPLPTTAPIHHRFDPRCYWRGPVWVNINWLYHRALEGKMDLASQTLKMVKNEGFYEYYHPHSGVGLGAKDFTWTAALCLDWLCGG